MRDTGLRWLGTVAVGVATIGFTGLAAPAQAMVVAGDQNCVVVDAQGHSDAARGGYGPDTLLDVPGTVLQVGLGARLDAAIVAGRTEPMVQQGRQEQTEKRVQPVQLDQQERMEQPVRKDLPVLQQALHLLLLFC